MAMAVMGVVGEQHLDYHAPLISVRRHYHNVTLDVENFSSARNSDVEDMEGERESGADFGRSPGAVPFFWERAPGVAKPEVVADYSRGVVPAIGQLRPPPAAGRSSSPTPAARAGKGGGGVEEKKEIVVVEEEEEEEVEVKIVETVKPAQRAKSAGPRGRKQREPEEEVASTRAFAERVASRSFFGEIALSAISERAASPGRGAERRARAACANSNLSLRSPRSNSVPPSPGSGQSDGVKSNEIEVFADASDSLPRTSYGWEGRLVRQPERDADQREYMLQRFLPAAVAAHANADHGRSGHSSSPSPSSGPGSGQRQGMQNERPMAPSPQPASRFAAVKKSGKPVEADGEYGGDSGRFASTIASRMGCGLLPRVMGRAVRQSAPCFPFRTRAKAKPKMSPIRSSFPAGNTTFDDDSQFDDAYTEFWDEEEEEEFLDRRLMEVRETENQLKVPGRSPPIGAPRFISGVPDKFQFFADGESVVATTNSPGNGYLGGFQGKLDLVPVHKAQWVDKESQSSSGLSSSSTSPESHADGGNLRARPALVPLHHDGRGFLGLPRRTPESELVPSRAAAYREYFHHEPRSSDRGGSISSKSKVPGVHGLQSSNKLEDFLRVERWNQPEGKDKDVQSWINHSPIPDSTIIASGYEEPKEVGRICEAPERAQSSRSSGEASFSDSEGHYFMSDLKSSETSSGTSTVSAEQDDSAAAAGKGWPLCQVQSSGNGSGPDKEAPHAGALQLPVPPLPPSPSQSWLWANLSSSAALNSQKASQVVLCKKYFDNGGGPGNDEPTSKWQLMVQSGNSIPAGLTV